MARKEDTIAWIKKHGRHNVAQPTPIPESVPVPEPTPEPIPEPKPVPVQIADPELPVFEEPDYDEMSVTELRSIARDIGLPRYTRYKKADLIDKIRSLTA